jgi:mono/diheme cytochrome c family protein
LRQPSFVLRRVTIIGIVVATTVAAAAPPRSLHAWSLYDRYCLSCHGAAGDGRGPAAPYTWPRPRDLTRGEFAFGDDLIATMRFGIPGTSMPAFALSPAELSSLVDVIRAFAPPQLLGRTHKLSPPPASDPARGAQLWIDRGCVACHGDDGRGRRELRLSPYDLTTEPLRRPRARDDAPARRRAAAQSIADGMPGTPMPSYTLPDADVWALADHVVELGAHSQPRGIAIAPEAIALDRHAGIATGRWPAVDPDEALLFGGPIEPQGPPPSTLAPAEASLDAQQCARCHAKQAREWGVSLHGAAVSPGLIAQIDYMPAKEAESCRRCHAPLAEQADAGPLRAEGVQCAGCHVRKWTRRGPPNVSPSLLADSQYPLVTLGIYERADFCLPCHQLAPRDAVNGKPLLDTYKEWLEGPYASRGIQCQHCHMPNREHQFLGIHDLATFKQGIQLVATARHIDRTRGSPVGDRSIAVVAQLKNIGAGHSLPTTTTPAVWLVIELVDDHGTLIYGATARMRIGRDMMFDGSWHEREDTRIPPGEVRTMVRAWSGGRTAQATHARVTVEVSPDDYYEHFYEAKLAGTMPAAQRRLYEQALARTRRTQYRGGQILVPIAP